MIVQHHRNEWSLSTLYFFTWKIGVILWLISFASVKSVEVPKQTLTNPFRILTTGERLNNLSTSSSSTDTSSSTSKTGFLKREEMLGKPVVGQDAMIVGTVKDMAVAVDGKAGLQVERKHSDPNSNTPDMFVGSDEILAVGDFVLLKSPRAGSSAENVQKPEVVSPPPFPGGSQSKICSKCGFSNKLASRFCVKCGTML